MPTADLWLDVTTLLRCGGRGTGIPRTVSELAAALAQMPGLRPRFCVFQDLARQYAEVPRQAVPLSAPAASSAPAERPPAAPRRTWRARLRALHHALPADLQTAGREGYSALQHLKTFLSRQGRASALGLGRGLLRGAARLGLRREAPAPFGDGDVLFVPGASWDDPGAFDALARIKQTRRLSVVPVVYDVIPARLPHACEPLLVRRFAPWIRKLLAESDLILTISQFSRRDLLALAGELGVPAPPVEVMRLGDAPAGFSRAARPAALPPGVKTFALSVGTFEVRKNHWLLYHVWRRLVERHGDKVPPLVLAGRPGWATKDVRQLIRDDPLTRDRVLVLYDATDEGLSWLYANCLFTLYPSHYEGWGLPVAEGLAHGKLCVCSDAASLPEVGGGLADYHDPLDATRCLERVERVLFEPGYREAREALIRREFRGATWGECAAGVVPLMERRLGARLAAPPAASEAA